MKSVSSENIKPEEKCKKDNLLKLFSNEPELVALINSKISPMLTAGMSENWFGLTSQLTVGMSEQIAGLVPQLTAGMSEQMAGFVPQLTAGMSENWFGLTPQITAGMSEQIAGLVPQLTAGNFFMKNIIPISGMYELFNDAIGLSFSNLMQNTFSDSVHDVLKEYRETLNAFKGYSLETFLPVHRVNIKDNLDEEELEKAILSKEKEIINSAKNVHLILRQEDDPFAPAFNEIIGSIENGTYFSAQALSANIFGMIREFRLKDYTKLHDGKPFKQMSTIKDYKEFFDFATTKYKNPKEIFLVVIILQLFIHTKYLNEDPLHLPSRTINRSASVHSHIGYYSKYNSLCFLLYLSEVFELVHQLKRFKDSVVVAEEDWTA